MRCYLAIRGSILREGFSLFSRGKSVSGRLLLLCAATMTLLGASPALCADSAKGKEARPIPRLDTSRHTVPLEEIYFDTFGRGSVPLSEAPEGLILRLRDAIPPLNAPRYGGRLAES